MVRRRRARLSRPSRRWELKEPRREFSTRTPEASHGADARYGTWPSSAIPFATSRSRAGHFSPRVRPASTLGKSAQGGGGERTKGAGAGYKDPRD